MPVYLTVIYIYFRIVILKMVKTFLSGEMVDGQGPQMYYFYYIHMCFALYKGTAKVM